MLWTNITRASRGSPASSGESFRMNLLMIVLGEIKFFVFFSGRTPSKIYPRTQSSPTSSTLPNQQNHLCWILQILLASMITHDSSNRTTRNQGYPRCISTCSKISILVPDSCQLVWLAGVAILTRNQVVHLPLGRSQKTIPLRKTCVATWHWQDIMKS